MILRILFFILILVSLETAFTATSNEDDVGRMVFHQISFNPASRPGNYINAIFESEGLSIRRYGGGGVLIKGETPLGIYLEENMSDQQIILTILKHKLAVHYTNFVEGSAKLYPVQ